MSTKTMGRMRSLRLLLVEDNPGDADLIRDWLSTEELCRFDLSSVTTLESARHAVNESIFDAIILDLSLPDSQGVETISRLRAACGAVPILVLSGTASDELRLAAYRAGAQDFIGKDESPGPVLARGVLYTVERFCVHMQQHYLEGLVSANPDAVLVVDLAGVVQFVNEAALSLFGRTRDDFVGDLFDFPLDEGLALEIEIQQETDRRTAEMRVARIQWTGQPAYLATLRDMTEYKRIESQLRQSQKMDAIGRLAGGVAHDFNNLLTVVNGYTEVLLEDGGLSRAQQEMLGYIREAGMRAKSLTGQLLAFGRKSVLNVEPINVNAVLSEISGLLRRLIGEDITLELKLDPLVGDVLADRTQLEQIVVNLAVNARDAMEQGGNILFETLGVRLDEAYVGRHDAAVTMPPGDYVRLCVSDTGPGMTPDVRARIFEPFFTTKASGKGTGLGLATVYGIVTQMNGHISCYSEPGMGAQFSIYLPASRGGAAVESDLTPAPAPQSDGHETILLVEDDDGVRTLIARILVARGFRILEAANGDEAIETARGHTGPIHLILTDVVLPGMTGVELAQRVRAVHPESKTLFISGYTDDAIHRRGLPASDKRFLQKPFTPTDLVGMVRGVLDTHPDEA